MQDVPRHTGEHNLGFIAGKRAPKVGHLSELMFQPRLALADEVR
jgi:hypothetical protein